MRDDGIIADKSDRHIPDTLYEEVSDEQRKEFANYKSIEIDTE